MAKFLYHFVLLGLLTAYMRDWSKENSNTESRFLSLAVKDVLHGYLRRARLWGRLSPGGDGYVKGRRGPAWLILSLLLLSGDVETNPGPETKRPNDRTSDVSIKDSGLDTQVVDELPVPDEDLSSLARLEFLNWFEVGIQLGISKYELDIIKTDYSSTKQRKIEMFQYWLDNGINKTYQTLIRALVATGDESCLYVAVKLCTDKGFDHSIINETQDKYIPPCITKYAEYLKKRYLDKPVIDKDPWPPVLSTDCQYINLSLVKHDEKCPSPQSSALMQEPLVRGEIDKIMEHKEAIELEDVFKPTEDGRPLKILIDGAPGIGKTTLCKKISQDWAQGKLLQEYTLVVLLHLRVPSIMKASKIDDMFYHDDTSLIEKVVKYICHTGGAKVLVLLDGFDELSRREREKESLFLDIFKGNKLTKCSVVVTSRPHASETLQCEFSLVKHVEILGFMYQQIEQIFISYLGSVEKGKDFSEKLSVQHPTVYSLCRIPLNCSIILYVYTQNTNQLPNTLTELFQLFIENTKQRQKRIYDLKSDCVMESMVTKLSNLAFEGLEEDKLVFQSSEIDSNTASQSGLLTAVKSFSSNGETITYQFLHLTIQEYLAAEKISKLSLDEQVKFLLTHLGNNRYRLTLIFFSGITKLNSTTFSKILSSQQINMQCFIDDRFSKQEYLKERSYKLFLTLVEMVFEAQNPECCSALAWSVTDSVLCLRYVAYNQQSLYYFISKSQCKWNKIHLLTIGGKPMVDNSIISEQFDQSICSLTQVKVLTLGIQLDLTIAGFDVMDLLQKDTGFVGTTMNSKYPSGYPLNEEFYIKCILNSSLCKSLEYFNFMYDNMPESISFHLWENLSKITSLKHLLIQSGILNDTIIDQYMLKFLSQTSLKSLITEYSPTGFTGFSSIGYCKLLNAITQSKSIETFRTSFSGGIYIEMETDIQYCMHHIIDMSDYNRTITVILEAFENILTVNESLHCLSIAGERSSMQQTGIQILKVCPIFRGLASNTSLRHLTINCSLLWSESRDILRVLSQNKTLTSLAILNVFESSFFWKFTSDQFVEGLSTNRSLKRLCFTLTEMKRVVNGKTHQPDLTQLFKTLQYQTSLEILVLEKSWPLFEVPYIHRINYEVTFDANNYRSLLNMLIHNKSLTTLKIYGYYFPAEQLKSIARSLVLNGCNRELNLVLGCLLTAALIPIDLYKLEESNAETIQQEVDQFKRVMLKTLFTLLHRFITIRQQLIAERRQTLFVMIYS